MGVGPIIPDIFYHFHYKICIGMDIMEGGYDSEDCFNLDIILKKDKIIINKICDKCSKYEIFELTSITKRQYPYKKAYCEYKRNIIKDEDIIKFFKEE